MKLLGIDYGTKRIGLAWADTTLSAVLPFGVIAKQTAAAPLKEIQELIVNESIGKVIVGFPLGLDGQENRNTDRVKQFAFTLQKALNIPVELFDERFTSQLADRLARSDVSRDELAATAILEGYLERNK
ncbi:MAG: Holliday junction resolvase RuvX [Candidatus Magasanikbacteria bacterium]|nr:Holliday junction resolvase RuvX [Candidatus Magasanikbacteria bacterium]